MNADSPKRIAVVATEDWFVLSHFKPLLEALMKAKHKPVVICRVGEAAQALRAMGVEVVALDLQRERFGASALWGEIALLRQFFQTHAFDGVHLIALRMVILGGMAAYLAGVPLRVHAITGLGALAVRRGLKGVLMRFFLRRVLRFLASKKGAAFLFENEDDPKALSLSRFAERVHIIQGAGVDVGLFPPSPLPPQPPLKLALVARMVRSKGIEIAVQAVERARAQGVDVTLSLFGEPDVANPDSLSVEELEAFNLRGGIAWHGRTANLTKVWREHHGAVLLSLGGEGLPKTLLEAAAAGRAIISTDTAGCRHFVVNEETGLVVAPSSVEAAAEAIVRLAQNPESLALYGQAGRKRVLSGFTTQHNEAAYGALYEGLLVSA